MIRILLTIFLFWYTPMKDIRKARAVTGIGENQTTRIDQTLVEAWKAGRIRSRKLWTAFGTVIIFGTMLSWVIDAFLKPGAEVSAENAIWMTVFSYVVLACIVVGCAGFIVSVVMSALNNKKHLGTFVVSL